MGYSKRNSTLDRDEGYWAAQQDPVKLVDGIKQRIQECCDQYKAFDRYHIWAKTYAFHYGTDVHSLRNKAVEPSMGDPDTTLALGDVRNHITSIVGMITAQRPSFDAAQFNSDVDTHHELVVADAVLKYYENQAGIEHSWVRQVEMSLIAGEWYSTLEWDPAIGPLSIVEDTEDTKDGLGDDEALGQEDESGDPEDILAQLEEDEFSPEEEDYGPMLGPAGGFVEKLHAPWDVFRQVTVPHDDVRWHIVRTRAPSVWDLVAEYPAYSEEIVEKAETHSDQNSEDWADDSVLGFVDSHQVAVYTLYHRPTRVMPEGRRVVYISGMETPVFDGPLLLRNYPVSRMAPFEMDGTSLGYTPIWDILGLMHVKESMLSVILTRANSFALPTIFSSADSQTEVGFLADGLQNVTIDGPPPTIWDGFSIPRGIETVMDIMDSMAESYSGMNSVVRGNSRASLGAGASGRHASLMHQVAMQYVSLHQQSAYRSFEQRGNIILEAVKMFATRPVLIEIAGTDHVRKVITFKGQDLNNIARVMVTTKNLSESHPMGVRAEAAKLLEAGQIDAASYIRVVTTGSLAEITKPTDRKADYIGECDRRLLLGPDILDDEEIDPSTGAVIGTRRTVPAVPVLLTDDHPTQILARISLLESVASRTDPAKRHIVDCIMTNIAEHETMWKRASVEKPALLRLRGIAMYDEVMMGGQQPPPGAPPPEDAPPPPGGAPPPPEAGQSAPPSAGGAAELPDSPVGPGGSLQPVKGEVDHNE